MLLHNWCYLLGLIFFLTGAAIVLIPEPVSRFYNALPRSEIAGRILCAIAWVWAGYALWAMQLDFLMPYKKFLPLAVIACIAFSWNWLDNLLTCRAFGAILTLFPYELLHVARVHASPWRLVVIAFAYVCIVEGMILLLYPWKMRQVIVWFTHNPDRFRIAGVLNAVLGLILIGLGANVLR